MPSPHIVNEPIDEHLIRYGMPFVPRMIARARGTLLWDTDGRELLDFTSGQMCATLGHNHPRILEAIAEACQGVSAPVQRHAEPASRRTVASPRPRSSRHLSPRPCFSAPEPKPMRRPSRWPSFIPGSSRSWVSSAPGMA